MKKLLFLIPLLFIFSCERYIDPEPTRYECTISTKTTILQCPYEDRIFIDSILVTKLIFCDISIDSVLNFENNNTGRYVLSTTEATGDIFVITKSTKCKLIN